VELPSAKLDCFVALLLAMTGLSRSSAQIPLSKAGLRSSLRFQRKRFAFVAGNDGAPRVCPVLPQPRHCERSEAIQLFPRGAKADCSRGLELPSAKLDCFVASLLAMTGLLLRSAVIASAAKQSSFCGASGQR